MNSLEDNQIPERLIQGDRPVDPDFYFDESLFHRFHKLLDIDEHIYPSSIRFPNFSVNRSKYSESYDVLIPKYFDWGIYSFQVQDIPEPIPTYGGKENEILYEFYAEHAPMPDNYSHSEVRVSKDGVYEETMSIKNKIVKMTFRIKLSGKAKILKYPE